MPTTEKPNDKTTYSYNYLRVLKSINGKDNLKNLIRIKHYQSTTLMLFAVVGWYSTTIIGKSNPI